MRTSYQFMVLSATVCFALLAGCASRNQELEVLAVEIVDSLATANYSAVTQYFDATMREKLPVEDLQSTWEALVRQHGPYEARTGTRVTAKSAYQIVSVTTRFAQTTLDVKVVFNSDNQVAGLWIVPPASAGVNQELEVLAVEIVDSLAIANYSAVTQYFDATMREKLPIEDLQSTWEALVRQYGPYEARTGTRVAKQAKYWIVFVTVDFAEKTLDVKVVFNSDNQVAGLWIVPESPD